MSAPFPHLPFLDRLQPEAGWRTDCAVVSTYSAQMPVIAAVLLAMAGEVDEAGSGSRVGLVRALTRLRGKVHIVLQSGRLTNGRHDTAIAGLFDQFLVQVPWDETAGRAGKSWHAKFVLARQLPVDPEQSDERWVFLLGSRNLTLDTSWDIGFSLEGGAGVGAQHGHTSQRVDGIAQLVRDLAAGFPALKPWSAFEKRLRTLSWWVPDGLQVTDLQLMLPDQPGRALPSPPKGLRRLVAVSPFLDKGALQELMRWPFAGANASRQLLSTRSELARVLDNGRLEGNPELLALAEPTLDNPAASESDDDSELEPERIGLHAKLILAEHAGGSTLWLGSPNLTRRAWTRNAEAIVRVDCTNQHGSDLLRDGLTALLERANRVEVEELQCLPIEQTIQDRLAAARNHVAARLASASQRRDGDGRIRVECTDGPHAEDAEVSLQCGQIRGVMAAWPLGAPILAFPEVATVVESECLNCSLVLKDFAVNWVQVVRFEPPLNFEERDAKVLSEYLGSGQMLAWIHSVLSGYSDGDEGGRWDKSRDRAHSKSHSAAGLELPTLEQALRMWLKDRSRLDEVDRILELRRQIAAEEAEPAEPAREDLDRFASMWQIVRAGLRDVAP